MDPPPESLRSVWCAILFRALKALEQANSNRSSFTAREIIDYVDAHWDQVAQGAEFRRKFSVELTRRLQPDSALVELDRNPSALDAEQTHEAYWKLRLGVDSYDWSLITEEHASRLADDLDLEPAPKRARSTSAETKSTASLLLAPAPGTTASGSPETPTEPQRVATLADIESSTGRTSAVSNRAEERSASGPAGVPRTEGNTRTRPGGHSARSAATDGGQRTIRRGGLVAQFSESVLARLKAGVPVEEIDPLELIDDAAILEWRKPPRGVPYTLSEHQRDPKLQLSSDLLTVTGERGFRSIRGIHGVATGDWFFEIQVLAGEPPPLPCHESVVDRDGVQPHIRVGFGSCRAEVSFPVGWEVHGYAYRDKTGDKVHDCIPEAYGSCWGQLGDVIGCRICLPPSLDAREEALIRRLDDAWFDFKGMNMGLGSKPKMPPPTELFYTTDRESSHVATGTYIEFFKNGVSQGIAFRNLIPAVYYPMISLYMGARCRANFGAEPFRTSIPPGCRGFCESTPPPWTLTPEANADSATFRSDDGHTGPYVPGISTIETLEE
jgi:hypothetical protein